MLIKINNFYWTLSRKKSRVAARSDCVSVSSWHSFTLIFKREMSIITAKACCAFLFVFVWTQKDVLLSSLCKNGKQITVSTNFTEAPVPLSDRHCFLLASSVTELLWWTCCFGPELLPAQVFAASWLGDHWSPRELSPAVPPVPPDSSQHSLTLHIFSHRMRAKGGMCFPGTKNSENLPKTVLLYN